MKARPNRAVSDNKEDFVERAERAMIRAGARAMADYKRFGIEPVIGSSVEKKKIESDGK